MSVMTRLEELKETYPEAFVPPPYIEDATFLARFGIVIPGKDAFSLGYLKHSPADFIVEEVGPNGQVLSVEYEDNSASIALLPDAPTYYATLVKCGLTTFQALALLAEQLGCPVKAIQYAGIKDQRAITAQRISIRGVRKESLMNVAHPQFFLKDVEAGNGVVTMGALTGNRFSILVRTDQHVFSEEGAFALRDALTYVRTHGFYNFFYLQRFGTPRLMNYEWGRDILKGEYAAVVRSVLTKTTPTEYPFFTELRESLATCYGDWSRMQGLIMATVPESLPHELNMLAYLIEHPDDYCGALQAIEQQSTFWVHAYISLLFNKLLSDHLVSNRTLPETFALALSDKAEDRTLYQQQMRRDGLPQPLWKHLRAFPQARAAHRTIQVKSSVDIHDISVCNEGIKLCFTLGKGQYATTFLSHLFNLVAGVDPKTETRFSLESVSKTYPSTEEYFRATLQGDAVVAEE